MSARAWCFTLNNPDGLLDVDFEQWDGLRYAVYQTEIGEQGTLHHQGYIELDRVQRLNYMKKKLPGAHFEIRRGTREQARAYCMKEETRHEGPWEYGDFAAGGQGQRNDIAGFKAAVDGGSTDKELWDSHPNLFLRYQRMLTTVRSLTTPDRTWKTEVHLCYGPPGVGKSHWVDQQAPNAYWHTSAMGKWFDNYKGEEDVVFDEYNGWLPWTLLLQLMDKYKAYVEVKGGSTKWVAKRLFITTNYSPLKWYGQSDNNNAPKREYPMEALTRRIDSWNVFLPGIGFSPQQPYNDQGEWNVIIRRTPIPATALEYM